MPPPARTAPPLQAPAVVPVLQKARASAADADLEGLPGPTARGHFKRLALLNRSLKKARPAGKAVQLEHGSPFDERACSPLGCRSRARRQQLLQSLCLWLHGVCKPGRVPSCKDKAAPGEEVSCGGGARSPHLPVAFPPQAGSPGVAQPAAGAGGEAPGASGSGSASCPAAPAELGAQAPAKLQGGPRVEERECGWKILTYDRLTGSGQYKQWMDPAGKRFRTLKAAVEHGFS